MKLLKGTLIILIAALIIGGIFIGVVALGSSPRGIPPARAIAPPVVQGGSAVRLRPGSDAPSINLGSAASNGFGMRTALGNLAVVGWVTLIGVVALRWLKSRRPRDAGSGRGDGPGPA